MKEISLEDLRPCRYSRSFTTSFVDFPSVAPVLRTSEPVCGRTGRAFKHHQRRVTFALPPCDDSTGGVAEVAGVKNWLRSRKPPSHETAGYRRGTLPDAYRLHHDYCAPTTAPSHRRTELGLSLLRACRDGEEDTVMQLLRKASVVGAADLNVVDHTGRSSLSYLASSGSASMLEALATLPDVDANIADTEGNTPLHFAAQAGHSDVLNILLSRCSGVDVDARNALGFTPLMKAALQGRTKCAKLLLIAGASPTLKDTGRGFRAEQWARFCGRYVCAEAIEKLSRSHLLDRAGRWGSEPALGDFVRPHQELVQRQSAGGTTSGGSWLRSKLRRAFRVADEASMVTQQLSSAALCASSPVLPKLRSAPSVPKLHVTPAVPVSSIPKEQRPSVRVAPGGPKKKKK